MVLNPTAAPNSHKVKKLDDLASDLGSDAARIRANEGEAANYGVYFDDTEYDYMQHLRDLDSSAGGGGGGGGDVVFVEAKGSQSKNKGKQKQSLEDALRQLDVEDRGAKQKSELLDDDILPSKNLRHLTYQAQQDVPDAIGGFQPDMDPRLREVLEALEDEAYVDDEDDIFQELAGDGRELDKFEFEEQADFFDGDDDDDGWESDDTAKPDREYRDRDDARPPTLVPIAGAGGAQTGEEGSESGEHPNENWLEDFKQFKKDQKTGPQRKAAAAAPAPSNSDLQSSLFTTTTNGGRRKKRKGALTSQSGYSMTSSSLVRTEQLSLLDERFEQLETRHYDPQFDDGGLGDGESLVYDDDDGGASMVSGVSTASSVVGPMRADLDGILDDFLGAYTLHGKKHLRKGGWKNGTEQLDEIRRELGPAHVRERGGARKKHPVGKSAAAAAASKGVALNGNNNKAAAAMAFGAPAVSR